MYKMQEPIVLMFFGKMDGEEIIRMPKLSS